MSGITLSGINKAFGTQQVLKDYSATIHAGERVALMGPSGSGKTTLARILVGLEKPDAGRVESDRPLRFAMVFQEDRLCPGLSAAANVRLVLPRSHWPQVETALSAVGLEAGLIEKPAAALSGGEKRRVALVRAVLAPSDALVLDEAFKGMDAETRQRAFDFVKARLGGRTLVVVTHEAAEAEAFDARILRVERVAQAQNTETQS